MTARLHTETPRVDARFPHFAPMLGATMMPYADPREVSGEFASGDRIRPEDELASREPVPELAMGALTSAASGALTGGLAAQSWRGAAIGAAANTGAWSLFTLLNAWRQVGSTSRIMLGTAAAASGVTAAALIWANRRRS